MYFDQVALSTKCPFDQVALSTKCPFDQVALSTKWPFRPSGPFDQVAFDQVYPIRLFIRKKIYKKNYKVQSDPVDGNSDDSNPGL